MAESWGVIPQNFNNQDASWAENPVNRSNNLQVENWERQTPSGNWGTDKPSAPAPSENNLSAKKTVQGSWGPNKSENSWHLRNESVQVDQSTWQTRKEESAISASEYNIKRENEEEKLDVGIQQSYESFKNDDYDRQHIVLDEDDYDPRYDSFSTSSKPQLGKSIATPFEEEIPFNTSETYNVKSRVEPLITSSNSTFQESPKKEFRNVEVQTDPIDISKIIASNEKLLSCTIGSPIKKEYQQTGQDLSNLATNSVSEKRYPPQQVSLLDVDPEEVTQWSSTTPKPNSDSWDSKPTSVQNDSWNAAQRTFARNDNRGPAPQSIPVEPDSWTQTSTRNDNRGTVPQQIPVTPDSWDAPPQTSARNDNRGPVPQQIPVTPDSWEAPPQTSARNDNRGPVPQQIPVTPDSWEAPPQTSARNDNRGPPQQIPVTPDSWDAPPQTSARNDNRGPVPQQIPVTPDSWEAPPQTSARNDNRGPVPQQIPVTPDSWNAPPQTSAKNDNRDPVPQSIPVLPETSAQNDNRGPVPQQIPVTPDSWEAPPQTSARNDNRGSDFQPMPSWGTVPQPIQNNGWNSGPQQSSFQSRPKDTMPQEGPKGSNENWRATAEAQGPQNDQARELSKNTNDQWGAAANRPADPTSDWTKKAEMFAKELGESSEIKVWEQTSNAAGQKAEDSYGTGASDSYYNNSSSNNRGCRNCGQEGHFARECPNKKQGYSGGRPCHNCGKEGHFARECPEENSKGGYGGGREYGGGKPCHKCGKEGHFARECPEESGRGGYGGGRSCHKCGKEGHIARECREDAYETTGEDFNNNSGLPRPHTKISPFSNPEPSDISSNEAWAKLLKACDEQEADDFSEALELYAKVTPEETFVSIEKKLRTAKCNGRIVALERPEIPLTKVLVDLQGNTNKKYVARPIMGHPSRLPRTSGIRANSEEENLEWLANSGFMVDDSSPVCFNCKQKGHITKDCPEPKREVEKPSYLTCQNCNSPDHLTKFCTQERRDYYVEARDRKVAGSYKGGSMEYSANEDRASSGYDGEDDRKGYRGFGSNSQTCHNCNREGHISRNCPEPKRGGGASFGYDGEDDRRGYRNSQTCHNCNQEGHISRDCPEPKRGGGGASSGYNGEDDRRGYRGYSNNSNQTCHNCNREGHISRECPEQRRGGRKCNKCGEEGHMSRDCTGSSGGDYDRGNYNSSNGWQRDSSSRNNDKTASWSTQDKGGDSTWNKARSDNATALSPRENPWNNPSGGDSSRGDHNSALNKSENDTYGNNNIRDSSLPTQNKGRDTSRQRDNQPVLIPKVENDSWDAPPKIANNAGSKEWGYKTADDFGWGKSNNENKTSAPGDFENRRGRGNEQRERTYAHDDYENKRGRGNDQRERTSAPDDYGNMRGRGNDQRERTYIPNDYDNRRGRGNEQRERTDDHENWRGRGNDQRERTSAPDDYGNMRGRGNDQRERTNKGPDYNRYSNSSRTQSNDANNQKPKSNLDEASPWW